MKAAGGPQKLRFTVHSCSGEVRMSSCARRRAQTGARKHRMLGCVWPAHDWRHTTTVVTLMAAHTPAAAACLPQDTDYPVRELLYHSPQTRGWQSPR
jgi:hypothetical protein